MLDNSSRAFLQFESDFAGQGTLCVPFAAEKGTHSAIAPALLYLLHPCSRAYPTKLCISASRFPSEGFAETASDAKKRPAEFLILNSGYVASLGLIDLLNI
jgi:hypothetical protein